MKLFAFASALIASFIVYADPACRSLSAFTGVYRQVFATCDTVMGADTRENKFIRVESFQTTDDGSILNGYWFVVANPEAPSGTGTGDGATTSPRDRFHCAQNGDTVSVNGPYSWSYLFSSGPSSSANLKVDGPNCTASYVRQLH